jgi:enoyl-CoA hydratase/carnithine racemase
MDERVKVSREGEIAVVRLDRPGALNAIDSPMRAVLIEAFAALQGDEAVGAVVVTGAGERAFSAGQDLAEAAAFELPDVETWMRQQSATLAAVRSMDKPVVAAFNGLAVGLGFQIGLLCDLRVGHAGIRLGQPEVRVGLASILGSYLMSLHLGHAQNVELSLMGRMIDGVRAKELGLLTELVAPEEVMPRAMALARELAALPRTALSLTKRRFREATQTEFDAACRASVAFHVEGYRSGEPQAIMRRFLAEREARGRGGS